MRQKALRRLLAAGESVDLRSGDADRDAPAHAESWGRQRRVPAALLAELATVPSEQQPPVRHLRLAGARITGTLDLDTAILTRRVVLQGCAFDEPPTLFDADMIGLDLSGSHLPGIIGDRLRCRGNVALGDGFASDGEVRLAGARIGGQFVCRGGVFHNPEGVALAGDGLAVEQDVFCTDGFTATGEARLPGARVGGQMSCRDGTFHNPGGVALNADRIVVEHSLFCTDGFTATGESRLLGAHIGGQLTCTGGTFHNPSGIALSADGIGVDEDVFCTDGFAATGEIRLDGARVGGQLACRGGSFRAGDGAALDLERAEVQANVLLAPDALEGSVGLRHASVGAWYDNELARSRPTDLHGFSYGSIYSDADEHGGPQLRERLRWVERNTPVFDPQPYEQLASVHGEEGNHVATRRVQVAKQRRRRANHTNPLRRWPAVVWSAFLRVTVGYGYRPWLVLWPLVVLLGLGTWLFGRAHAAGGLVAASGGSSGGGAEAAFSAVRYTLDLLLPVIGLRADSAYAAVGPTAWYTFGFTCAGWLLALVLVAGLTGVFKRRS